MHRSDREKNALEATAAIEVTPKTARLFLRSIAGVLGMPLILHLLLAPGSLARAWLDLGSIPFSPSPTMLETNARILDQLETVETVVRNDSPLARWVRPYVQHALFKMGAGNAQVRLVEGTLVYEPSLTHLLGPAFSSHTPMPAIAQFRDDLKRQGIELVLIPAPPKPAVDGLHFGMPGLKHPSWEAFRNQLSRYEVPHIDVYETLAGRLPHYLTTDTHWRPETMQAVAARTASVIRELGMPTEPSRMGVPKTVRGTGDLVGILGLPAGVVPPEEVVTHPSPRIGGPPRVLLMGDSFANIYHDADLGFGENEGLPAALESQLGVPVRTILINDDGAIATRQALVEEPDLLDGIEVVVWEFAERELTLGDWSVTRLYGENRVGPQTALHLAAEEQRSVRGVVRSVANRHAPEDAVYSNRILALRLELGGQEGIPVEVDHAWIYTWDFEARAPAELPPQGQLLDLTLLPFSSAPKAARSAARTPLDKPPAEPILWLEGWASP